LTNKGTPPIILAVNETRRASSDEVVSLLLDYGAPIDGIYKMMTPLMYACRDSHVECEDNDFSHCRSSLTTVELLLKRGADPNIIINNVSPLTLTYMYIPRGNTHIDTLKMLIKYGANQHLVVGGKSFYQSIPVELKEQLTPELMESEDIIEHKDLGEPECVFCLDSEPSVKFNCGHVCVCTNCYKFVYECYTCFELVKTFRKIKIKYT
jgi:ankyrin repeat protein